MKARVERLYDDLYVIQDMCNCYLLLGSEKALLVDTGVGLRDVPAAARSIARRPIVAVNTHAHIDHFGGNHWFDGVFVHRADEEVGAFQNDPAFRKYAVNAMPPPVRLVLPKRIWGPLPLNYRFVSDGETIDLGDRKVEFVHTPGHTPGSCCLYEPSKGYLFGGDTLVPRLVLLNLDFSETPAVLKASMEKLSALDVRKVFPGHHVYETDASLIADYIGACDAHARGEGFLAHDMTGMKRIVKYGKVQIECRADSR
ncbi:MAG: MBL fold metallo-hydrolase [Oscillospiraceae bacterium]|jgi:glyoxylase-like metal-dependent hydrolase (beta-lactamase superfamily II)|nr:MBL fold metallo-hydrolase [Oscillospiraceae bacterium]